MTDVKQASLLGIPPELRLNIYDYVLDEDVDITVIDRFEDSHSFAGFQALPQRNKEVKSLGVPWVCLIRTCRTMATEVRSHMRSIAEVTTSPAPCRNLREYALQMDLGRGHGNIENIAWQRVPCAPRDAGSLVVVCRAHPGLQVWGDGGPLGIVRSLYQTLNWFLHCGPLLDPANPLEHHLRLQKLVIRVEMDPPSWWRPPVAGEEPRGRDDAYMTIGQLLSMLCGTGLLHGYVNSVRITNGEAELSIPVKQLEDARVPEYWDRYGFEWGVSS